MLSKEQVRIRVRKWPLTDDEPISLNGRFSIAIIGNRKHHQ
jgi:hypothetical protein